MSETLPATLPTPVSPAQQQHIVNIVRRAARAEIVPRFRRLDSSEVQQKASAEDLVTQADIAAEQMITRALNIAFPQALVVGEESAAKNPSLVDEIADAPLAFIIDPVDGTWNFAHGLAVFGVILAVTQFGRPAFGLIYDPMADDWAIASDESNARLVRATGAETPIKPAMGKAIEDLSGFIPLHLWQGEMRAKLAAALPSFKSTNTLRCSAHEYRMVAQGHADFVISESLNPWDHAAGALICERAGCHVEMLDGGPYDAGRHNGHLLVAPDKTTWNRLKKVLGFLVA